jgi:hypothetical protein
VDASAWFSHAADHTSGPPRWAPTPGS